MKRVNQIWKHPIYQEKFQALQSAEQKRIFCKHTLIHFLDVARLMYIDALEQGLSVKKDMIYAMALLHDIGRIEQIKNGNPHEVESAVLCDKILPECGYTKDEIDCIKESILGHRNEEMQSDNPYVRLLYTADKKSRNCFDCAAALECNWAEEKRNLTIEG